MNQDFNIVESARPYSRYECDRPFTKLKRLYEREYWKKGLIYEDKTQAYSIDIHAGADYSAGLELQILTN